MTDTTIATIATPAAASTEGQRINPAARRFLYALLLATAFPFLFFMAMAGRQTGPVYSNIYQVLIFLSVAHVPLTAFFWMDSRYRGFMNKAPGTYYGIPIAIIASAVAVSVVFQAGLQYLLIVYFAWLLWHYGRQNWGLISLVAISTKSTAPSAFERRLYDAAAIAGILGAISAYGNYAKTSIFAPVLPALQWLGGGIMAVVLVCGAGVIYQSMRRGDHWIRVCMTLLVVLFFTPSFWPGPYFIAPFGMAHSIQYFVIMYMLAADKKQGRLVIRLGLITLAAVVGFYVQTGVNNPAYWGKWVMIGTAIGTGITMTHFFLDSRLWRLREPFQRKAVKESFAFLFN